MEPRLRWTVSLVTAVAAHALLFLLPFGSRPERRPPMRVVVLPIPPSARPPATPVPHITPRTRPAAAEPAAPQTAAPSELTSREPLPAAPLSRPAVAAETTETPIDPTRRGPRLPEPAIDLFAPAAIARVASAPDTIERRMERWTEQARAVENARHGAATPELVAFGERMNAWFTPPPDALAAKSTLGLGVLSSLVPLGRYFSSGRANTPSRMMEYLYGRRDNIGPAAAPELAGMRRAPDVIKLGLCFGACTDAEHEVARLETLVAVEHDTSGLPVDWRVATSSGDLDLDRER